MLPQLRFTFERPRVLRVLVDAVVRKAGAGRLHVALVPRGEELDGAARGGADGDVAALEVVAPRVSHYRRLRRRRREAGSRRRCDACGCPWRFGDVYMRPRRRNDQCCSCGGSGNDDARVCVAHCGSCDARFRCKNRPGFGSMRLRPCFQSRCLLQLDACAARRCEVAKMALLPAENSTSPAGPLLRGTYCLA